MPNGNILEALSLQKSICAFAQFEVFAQRVVPLFLISCAVSAHREEVNVWSASHARYITHKGAHLVGCAKIFLAMKDFSGFLRKSTMEKGISSSVQPYISLIAHSYQLRHKAFPIRGRYQSQRRHLHSGQERLIFILICKGRLPTHTIIVNEGIMWRWKCALFVAGEVANNWLEEQLNGQSKGGEWLCLHIWTDQR